MRGRALVSEDGAMDIMARASARGHTAADKAAALSKIKKRSCPQPSAAHVLWLLDDQGKLLLLCGGKSVAAVKPDPINLLGEQETHKLVARIRQEGFARHPPLSAAALEGERDAAVQLTGRQFEPWRWVVGATLSLERIRELSTEQEGHAHIGALAGAVVALLCLVGLVLLSRRGSRRGSHPTG